MRIWINNIQFQDTNFDIIFGIIVIKTLAKDAALIERFTANVLNNFAVNIYLKLINEKKYLHYL